MKKYTTLILTLLFPFQFISSELIHHFNVKDGLSSREVYQICNDSSGFIWAYTNNGADRYDGNEIRHYRLNSKVHSKDYILSSTTMECDRKGNLWVALKNGDLFRYERNSDLFKLYISLSEKSDILLYNIFFDNDDMLLCTSDGIYRLNQDKSIENVAMKGTLVNSIVRIGNKEYIAGTDKDLFTIKKDVKNHFSVKQINLPMKIDARSFFVHGNKLFVGTFSDGVLVVDIKNYSVSKLRSIITKVPIRKFEMSRDGQLMVGTDGYGVFFINPDSENVIKHYTREEDEEHSLADNTISDICADIYGGIWISTTTNGIDYLPSNDFSFYRIKHKQNNNNSLKSNHVNVIFQDSDGDRWFGTNSGVSLYEEKTGRWRHFLAEKKDEANVVLSISQDCNGEIWVGGYGMGLYCITKRNGVVRLVENINTDYIYSILSDGNYLWLGGITGNLVRYDVKTKKCTNYPINCIGDLKHGSNNTILIAGCNGLGVLDKNSGSCKWYNKFGKHKLQYPIRCILYSSRDEIWMAGDGDGLIRFNLADKKFRIYTINNGISDNSILSLLEDNDGNIWFTTEKELYCFNLRENKIFNSNAILGIFWGAFNSNAAVKLSKGDLAFGTADGCIVFSPSIHVNYLSSVKLIFTDFKLSYQLVKAGEEGSILMKNIDDVDNIDLKYNQNSFSISFSAINIKSPNRLRYEYMLDNYDVKWYKSENIKNVEYMNLSPGKYIFHLKAFDNYSGELAGERTLTICIGQPWWHAWWAYLLYITISVFILYVAIQIRRQKIAEYKIKEKIRSFVAVAHDIRTPVTLIRAPLNELDKNEDLSERNRKSVYMALKNADKLEEMINNLIDIQKTERQAEERLNLLSYNLKDYLEEKIVEFHLQAMQKGVEMVLDVEDEIPQVCIDREKIDHVIDNLISNAIKYTEGGNIHIKASFTKKKWTLEVKDTGIGIPKDEQKNIFHEFYRAHNAVNSEETGSGIGLLITKRIVEQHQGSISFTSVEGKGTTFTVSFPIFIKSMQKQKDDSDLDDNDETYGENNDSEYQKNVVLLAEDDEDMRKYLADSLSTEYKIVAVADGNEALEMAKKINPDIVITDVMMPLLRGDELCRILKSSVETSHIPVILLTALSERENIVFGLEAGASDYILKPFDLTVLKVRIRNILQSRQQLRDSVLSMNDEKIEEFDYSSQLDKDFIDKIMEIIQGDLSDSEFSINTLCRKVGMSRTSLYNKMKTLTGHGPNDFIRIIRLNKSKELLMSRKYSIGEVAVMVGFADPKYFSTCFKKQFGISPSKI